MPSKIILCRPKSLPLEKMEAAARRAVEINPGNAHARRTVLRGRRLAVLVARRWPVTGVRLTVSFLDTPPAALRKRILQHMNAWSEFANVEFTETKKDGQVRISRRSSPPDFAGYWSYIGTEILEAEPDQPTMNLEEFTMLTPDEEFIRVVRHETGHTLGFEHEHMRSDIVKRIDRKKAFAFYRQDQGWNEQEVRNQVLTPLAAKSIMGTTESDPVSIMCYQLPGEIMKDGVPVVGGLDISASDAAFAATVYPKSPPAGGGAKTTTQPLSIPVDATPPDDGFSAPPDVFDLTLMPERLPDETEETGPCLPARPLYVRVLANYGGAGATFILRVRKKDELDPPTQFGRIIARNEEIRRYTNLGEGALPSDPELMEFGRLLFDTLFQGEVRRLYDEARTRQGGRRLDLVLRSMVPWLAAKPWEFAYDTGRRAFLATEEIHFVRNVLTNVPADAVIRPGGPLRILVASAQPVGFGQLSIEQEERVIRRGFELLVEQNLVTIDVLARTTPEMLHHAIALGRYQVVHFIGHGVFDEALNEGFLLFENERGGEVRLGERSLRELFCHRGLSMVFLNSCESGRESHADFNRGIAQSMVSHGLPALVANQYTVLDASATSFAQHLYWALAQGLSIGEAAREARIAVNYSLNGDPIDWAVPVVFARNPSMTLCARPAARTMPARQPVSRRQSVVAVWDVDSVFPALETTVSEMNRAQNVFGFELARISAPLDIWDRSTNPNKTYLHADRVAARLKGRPAEMGADLLFCVTRHPLRDDEWLNLYNWWGAEPVLIFSVAGFDDLAPEGPATDRAIANSVVSCLAGYLADIGTHDDSMPECPLAFNESRDFSLVTGRQQFDDDCRAKLEAKLGARRLAALESLLRLF